MGIKEGKTQKAIALQIGVSASTVSRELRRNKSHRVYSYALADEMSRKRRERLPGNRKIDSAVEKEALRSLAQEDWSPKQISGYLRRKGYKISHETLYRRIRADHSGKLASHCIDTRRADLGASNKKCTLVVCLYVGRKISQAPQVS